MRTSQRNPAPRRPAKAKGTLPAPVVAPQRRHRAWYRLPGIAVPAGLALVALLVFGAWKGFQARARSQERKDQQRAVRLYERNFNLLQAPTKPIFQEMNSSPEEFRTGKLTGAQLKAQSDKWLEGFQKLHRELQRRNAEVPSYLQETNALFAQGTVLFIDSAKSFQIAGLATDPTVRDLALEQGKNLAYHAGVIFGNGIRAMERQKRRLGLEVDEATSIIDEPVLIPEEVIPTQPPSPAGVPVQPPGR